MRRGYHLENSKFLDFTDIHTIQIDHNSTCNLRCPQCARIYNGKLNSSMPKLVLPLSFYERIFTREVCSTVEKVFFCGNYGDVIASDNILEVCEFLRGQGLKTISIVTNGSLRNVSWWARLAKIFSSPTDSVVFSIDGLSDTNHLYRVGSQFNKIMENAKSFIAAGGRARWEYLVFSHNEHQVEEAKALAKSMGFKSFKMKKTNRFIQDQEYKSGKKVVTSDVFNAQQKKSHEISQPQRNDLQTKSMNRFEQIIQKHKSWDQYVENSKISCKSRDERSIFIDFNGDVWPCCWVAAPNYFYGQDHTQKNHLKRLLKQYKLGFNNLYKHSLVEILKHPWYSSQLVESWSGSTKDNIPKLMTCGRTCGEEYEFSSNAPENRILEKF